MGNFISFSPNIKLHFFKHFIQCWLLCEKLLVPYCRWQIFCAEFLDCHRRVLSQRHLCKKIEFFTRTRPNKKVKKKFNFEKKLIQEDLLYFAESSKHKKDSHLFFLFGDSSDSFIRPKVITSILSFKFRSEFWCGRSELFEKLNQKA